jgi:hypothetical protein
MIKTRCYASQPEESAIPSPLGWHEFGNILRTFGNNVQAYEDIRNLNRPFDDASYAAITSAGTLVTIL